MEQINAKRLRASVTALVFPVLLIMLGLAAVGTAGISGIWLLVPAVLALGLRHAFDADHITSIDNVVRALRSSRKPTHLVGFYFSLGHSTVVLSAVVVTVLFGNVLSNGIFAAVSDFSSVFVATFLTVIITVNLVLLSKQSSSGPFAPLSRLFHRTINKISSQWQMILIGFLFGLGLDTAVSLIAIVAAGALLDGLTLISGAGLALCFAGAMGLGDSVNTLIVNKVYSKAHENEKLMHLYQRILTFIIIVVAGAVVLPLWIQLLGIHIDIFDFILDNAGWMLALSSLTLSLLVLWKVKRKASFS